MMKSFVLKCLSIDRFECIAQQTPLFGTKQLFAEESSRFYFYWAHIDKQFKSLPSRFCFLQQACLPQSKVHGETLSSSTSNCNDLIANWSFYLKGFLLLKSNYNLAEIWYCLLSVFPGYGDFANTHKFRNAAQIRLIVHRPQIQKKSFPFGSILFINSRWFLNSTKFRHHKALWARLWQLVRALCGHLW